MKKLRFSLVFIILLLVMFGFMSEALMDNHTKIEDHTFTVGEVSLELLNDEPLNEMLFEPGKTMIKKLDILNNGTIDVYCRVYLKNLSFDGAFYDYVYVKISDEESNELYYDGSIEGLKDPDNIYFESDLILNPNETKHLTMEFYYSKDSDNEGQAKTIEFEVAVDATQVKNNPNKEFE